jgi:hypothetical protein
MAVDGGQGGGADIEAQMHRVQPLIDLLSVNLLGAYRGIFNLGQRNYDFMGEL